MSIVFPSVEFFQQLQKGLADDPASAQDVTPSEAYCGVSIDGQLFVLEFDERECSAVISGGNPLDLDFVLAGSRQSWLAAIAHDHARPLGELIESGDVAVEPDEDEARELAQAALPMLQVFFDQAKGLEVEGSEAAA